MFKPKTKSRLKRTLSGALALAMTASLAAVMPAAAEETAKYPYAIFAADEAAGISVNTDSFTLNGNAYTNGVFSTTAQYPNINGTVTDHDDIEDENNTEVEETEDVFNVSEDMILIHTKLADKYFTENCDTYNEDYTYSDMNVNINNSVYVTGKLNLDGNISLNNAVGAVSDVDLSGGNLNGNNTVIYSKFGDIDISNSQASVNGLIYAPFGTVTIDCDNFNMNGLIIAQNVVIDGYGANINYSSSWAELVGTESEELSWTFDDWQYLADTDEDGLPNLIEKEIGSDPYDPDTDGDNLPDGYEALTLGTDPTKPDTDDNGVLDCDEDFDEDGLTNLPEYEQGTEPYNDDTDGDGLKDGEEINTYGTDPLKVDTDEDGLEDGDDIFSINRKIEEAVAQNQVAAHNNNTDKFANFLFAIPILPGLLFGLVKLMDRCGVLPRKIIDLSPFHTSLFITNLASINTNSIFHHCYEFGTTGVFVSMGKPIANYRSGEYNKKMIPLSVVMDERICTGHEYALFWASVRRYLKHPELLEGKPTEENADLAEECV